MDRAQPERIAINSPGDRSTRRMHPVYQIRRSMGVQQYSDQEGRRVEGRVPYPRRIIRTPRYVLRVDKFPLNLSNNDEYHLSPPCPTQEFLHLYGRWRHSY